VGKNGRENPRLRERGRDVQSFFLFPPFTDLVVGEVDLPCEPGYARSASRATGVDSNQSLLSLTVSAAICTWVEGHRQRGLELLVPGELLDWKQTTACANCGRLVPQDLVRAVVVDEGQWSSISCIVLENTV